MKNAALPQKRPAPAAGDAPIDRIIQKLHTPRGKLLRNALAAAVVLVLAGYTAWALSPMQVTVNGVDVGISRSATLGALIERAGIQVRPGRLLAVDGSVISPDGGQPYSVTVNGQAADQAVRFSPGDHVQVANGADVVEDATESQAAAQPQVRDDGTVGAVHQVVGPLEPGTKTVLTGAVSGITVDKETIKAPVDGTLTRFNVSPADGASIALTFDDGPWNTYTEQILDVLDTYGVRATFFVVGTCFDGSPAKADLVRRQHESGHQVSTHSYSHAAGDGQSTNLGFMSPEQQLHEISHGQQGIADVTGAPVSRTIRAPGGNFSEEVATNTASCVDYEIGWNVDTHDWQQPGTDRIKQALLAVEPGDIVLMHDGGGDRSQTVEALQEALPLLIDMGYNFVTVDELIAMHASYDDEQPFNFGDSLDSSDSFDFDDPFDAGAGNASADFFDGGDSFDGAYDTYEPSETFEPYTADGQDEEWSYDDYAY